MNRGFKRIRLDSSPSAAFQVRPRHPQQVGHAADLGQERALQGPPPQDGQQALLLLRAPQDQGVPPRRAGRKFNRQFGFWAIFGVIF